MDAPEPIVQVFNILGPYIEWVDQSKMLFTIKDGEIHEQTIEAEEEILSMIEDIFRYSGWIERIEFLGILKKDDPKATLKDLHEDIDFSIKKGEIYQTTLGVARWLKLSPEGDFQAAQDNGAPMYG